jgi:hypothetical protein
MIGFKDGKCFYIDFKGGGIDEDKEHKEEITRGELPNCDSCHKGRIFTLEL